MNSSNQTGMTTEDIRSNPMLSDLSYIFHMLIASSLLFIQASLLHPCFAKNKLAKYVRIGLTPINFFLFISQPFRRSSRLPESYDTFAQMGWYSNSIMFATFALDFGFANEAYYKRPLENSQGIYQWKKITDQDELKRLKKSQENESLNFSDLFFWTLSVTTSFRGLQFNWGHKKKANNQTVQQMVSRVIKVAIPLALAGLVIIQTHRSPLKTPISALNSIGIPNLWGLSLISEWAHRFCFGVFLSSSMDLQYTVLTILLHYLHQYLIKFDLSKDLLELINPVYYPPLFDSPHLASSLNDLWSNRWHANLKRSFLVLGGRPTFWFFNQILGFNFNISRIGGLVGTFVASGILHEYVVFALLYPSKPLNHLFDQFPAQSIGIIIESFIPKKFSKLFCWPFVLCTSKVFVDRYLIDAKILDLSLNFK
ncbi:uncharacterized protein MELLADRAFT_101030 [Melampsora larici-populina 98AG31]|uniref:Wax synthase domain-containing protein n=1 Tax=Melampsora larici-populina (strain 98AG31 / pathotype 3-4-7) TaxID=747676 RepID=F4R3E3_MELLP|nr:uncharacterized protein MELLADRAFT_101030 [Melampsora larici-populina 98AG31]EGG12614.1 hypothetical protein MELLADRAFT_101030 [Melampsora larici-populina 98AG31]